jgi:hypothetical protein
MARPSSIRRLRAVYLFALLASTAGAINACSSSASDGAAAGRIDAGADAPSNPPTDASSPLPTSEASANDGSTDSGDDAGLFEEGGDSGEAGASDAAPIEASITLASGGCPMAHCTPQQTDRDVVSPPDVGSQLWQDTSVLGSTIGVGCSSDGTFAACSLVPASHDAPALVVYRADGSHLWSSNLLGVTAFSSAPIFDQDHGVIAADSSHLIRFDASGNVVWNTTLSGGLPISPVPVAGQFIFLATGSGMAPISLYDAATGAVISSETVYETGAEAGQYYYKTANTPAVSGSRVYISMQRAPVDGGADANPVGRLVAFDATSAGLVEAWRSPPFQGPSGASPTVIGQRIFFDGAGPTPTDAGTNTGYYFGLDDHGTSASFAWATNIGSPTQANAPVDPRGGLWVWATGQTRLMHLSSDDGTLLGDSIADLGTLLPSPSHTAAQAKSDITMVGSDAAPVMILSIAANDDYVCALDLGVTTSVPVTRRWCFDGGNGAPGQFPVVTNDAGAPIVVFSTQMSGVFGVGAP